MGDMWIWIRVWGLWILCRERVGREGRTMG